MKIILFTFDDAYFVPMLNRDMVRKYGDKIERVYISRDLFSVNKFLKKYNYFFKNGYPFCISIMDLVRFIKWRLIVAFGQSSVKDYFTNKGIKVSYVDNINSKSFLKELRSLEPDVVLFVPFDKIAKDEFISIPNIGTYNLHLGKIPEYKGGFSSFWILRNLDKIAGVTMHEVVKEIDSGRIISEVRFNHDENSMKKLMELTVDKAADLILKSIESIQDNDYTYISIKDRETNYYLYPSRKDFKIFYQNGNKLI